jgi:two-component system OmpR family response regulator
MFAKSRVLVTDDDHDIRDLIRAQLESAGYEVHVARNGSEALGRISSARPHAMVLDINMPELDGFGVLEALKARNVLFPVLVLTARHAEEDVRRAVSLGAKDYLSKPFSEAQLKARVARLLRIRTPLAPAPLTVG